MVTVTIRNLPDDVAQRIKSIAATKGHSMEQEIRELLETRYASRWAVISRIHQRGQILPKTTSEEVKRWKEGRHHGS